MDLSKNTKSLSAVSLLAIALFAIIPFNLAFAQADKGLRISAVLPNPDGDDSLFEFVEIYNDSGSSINLKDYSLTSDSNNKQLYIWHQDDFLKPGEFIYLASKVDSFKEHYPNELGALEVLPLSSALINSANNIALKDAALSTISSIKYQTAKSGIVYAYWCDKASEVAEGAYAFAKVNCEIPSTPTITSKPSIEGTTQPSTSKPASNLNSALNSWKQEFVNFKLNDTKPEVIKSATVQSYPLISYPNYFHEDVIKPEDVIALLSLGLALIALHLGFPASEQALLSLLQKWPHPT
jgi:hypothetical protein